MQKILVTCWTNCLETFNSTKVKLATFHHLVSDSECALITEKYSYMAKFEQRVLTTI